MSKVISAGAFGACSVWAFFTGDALGAFLVFVMVSASAFAVCDYMDEKRAIDQMIEDRRARRCARF